ncbi:MAG TPA: type VII secretion target [Candidatus Dormibacteraeota bacterium]|jgi:uncharacterized protein YukE
MATDPGFHVDPAALRSLAGGFEAQAEAVRSSTARFGGPARLVDRAFGVVGPSNEVYNQYQQAVTSALSGLAQLETLLQDAATNLRQGAANYERADHSGVGRG